MQKQNFPTKPRKNYQIKISPVRLINANGENVGVVQLSDAMQQAKEAGLDLVEINPTSKPPVVKITDYGKMLYDEKKKAQVAKKNQVIQELKEITFRPNTDVNDLLHKLETAKQFLINGDRVKFTVRFRGREITHPEVGKAKLEWILSQLTDLIMPNSQMSMEAKLMSMTVYPKK